MSLSRNSELARVSEKRQAAIERGDVRTAYNSTLQPSRMKRRPKSPETWAEQYHSDERRAWVSRQPSVASGDGPCVNAHVRPIDGLPVGIGRKASFVWIVPLTAKEHDELHEIEEAAFSTKYGVDLQEACVETQLAWLEYIDPDPYTHEPDEDALLEARGFGG